jgi:hypothetical protein
MELQQPVRSLDDVAALSGPDRALLARWLADTNPHDDLKLLSRLGRVASLVLLFGGAILLVPWVGVLFAALPDHHSAHQWRIAWGGFDVALTLAFATTALLGWRRLQLVTTSLVVLGVLLLCDAWFDVTLSWGTSEQAASILSAAILEVPVAIISIVLAHRVLRETAHYIWHLEGCDDPVPALWRLRLLWAGPQR